MIHERKADSDLNVTGVGRQGITGKGVNGCLIDDGVDYESLKLNDTCFSEGSYDFNAHTSLPKPRLSDDQHGTRGAGEIAAVKNEVFGVGVAYDAHVSGVGILSGPITDVDEGPALSFAYQDNQSHLLLQLGPFGRWEKYGCTKGVGGKSGAAKAIYSFCSWEWGASDDQCNFDGYIASAA